MRTFPLLVAAAALLAGCNPLTALAPYRMEIQQGNYIDPKAMTQLRVGMTRDQVRAVLGTPLVTDVFHANRWDYVFWRQRANRDEVEEHRLSLFFENDRLARFEGDANPPEAAAGGSK